MSQGSDPRQRRCSEFIASLKAILRSQQLGDLLISSGHLTQGALQYALVHQKTDNKNARLGRILIEQRLVSRRALYRTLAQQWTLRCLAATMTFMISFGGGIQAVRAGTIEDVPGQISLVSAANNAFAPMHSYPALFGTEEKASRNITPFTKWSGMYTRFEADIHDPKYSGVLKKWRNALQPLAHLPIREMAQQVNDMMNAHPYIHDDRHMWGVSDYWETPLEFLTYNGDCKDYAIAKYASLRMLGIPEDRLRIAVVQDLGENIPHAIVLLYTDDDTLILDNQNRQVLSSSMVSRYQPIFSINREGWWLHRAPDAAVLASAQ